MAKFGRDCSSLVLFACLGKDIFVFVCMRQMVMLFCVCVHAIETEMLCTFLCWGLSSPLLSLSTPVGRQVSQRLAEEAIKRERFEELKQHLEQEQEVGSLFPHMQTH